MGVGVIFLFLPLGLSGCVQTCRLLLGYSCISVSSVGQENSGLPINKMVVVLIVVMIGM